MAQDYNIGAYADLRTSERVVLDVGGIGVGVYFVGDEVRAWRNICPHLGGPVCQGKTMPRTLQGVKPDMKSAGLQLSKTERNIVCPWHGFEFDILTGQHPIDTSVRLSPIAVRVEGQDVILTI